MSTNSLWRHGSESRAAVHVFVRHDFWDDAPKHYTALWRKNLRMGTRQEKQDMT